MTNKNFLKQARKYSEPFRITDGAKFRLKKIDPGETLGFGDEDEERAEEILAQSVELLRHLQDKLYAQDRWAVLIIFQAMDAAGKDGAIKNVMSGVNPQGCEVSSFKVRQRKSWTTTFSGGVRSECLSAAASESSTAVITKKHSSCAFIRNTLPVRNSRRT
jgi:polyphosphate kinase 2 (PPK2 family)